MVISSSTGIVTRTNYWGYNSGVVSEVFRNNGPVSGGTYITITGVDFGDGIDITQVTLVGVPATVLSQSATQVILQSTVSSIATSGPVVILSTSLGYTVSDYLSSDLIFEYNPAGSITSVTPNEGPKQGGTKVVITGTDLSNGYHDVLDVTFNEVTATVLSQSPSEIVVITGDGTYYSGKAHVVLSSRSHGVTLLRDAWTYLTGCCWRHPHAICTVPPEEDPACVGIVSFID